MRDGDFCGAPQTLGEWAGQAHPPITYDYNKPALSRDIFSTAPVDSIPPPQTLYDMAAFKTPFSALFRKARTAITG